MQTLMNSQSDGGGGVSLTLKEKRKSGHPCPSTSNCDQIPHCPAEDEQNVELNVLQSCVIQGRRGGNEEELNMIISSKDDGVYEIPEARLGLFKNTSSPGVKTTPTKAPSRTEKPIIPIIPARPLRRRRRDCHVPQAENIKPRNHSTSQVNQEFQSTSHIHTPAVPSKNVQNAPVTKSIAEQMGLRKPKRRASDQSEHSLDRVKELRLRGREVQVGSKWKAPILPLLKGINLKLDPQETQFHKQKHDQIHKVTSTSPTKLTTPLSLTTYAKKAKRCNSKGEKLDSDENEGDNAIDTNMQSFDQESIESKSLSSHNLNVTVVPVDSLPLPREQPDETIQPSPLPHPPALDTPTTLHQSGDSLKTFPKSSMTTVKTFTPISRSDSLVKDMEKLPSPKPKTAPQVHMSLPHLPQLPSAQPEVRPPPVVKVLTFPAHNDKQACKNSLEQPPRERKETHTEPFASPRRPRTFILKANILNWKYSWFKEFKQFGPPKALCDLPLKLVPQSFRSFMDYYNTFFPLLLTNTFEELVSEWQMEDRVRLKLMVQSVDYERLDNGLTVNNANFTVILTHEEESHLLYPKESDVVILWLPQNLASHVHSHSSTHWPNDCQPHFGIVSLSEFTGVKRELKLQIQTCGNVLATDKQLVQCEVVGSVLHAVREFRALCQIDSSALIHTILAPDKHFLPDPESTVHFLPGPESTFEGCNTDQSKAIDCVVSMVMSEQPAPKICLINAPPGTGKSHTIVNLLYQLSQRLGAADSTGQKHWCILVCAPSIVVVDSLIEKINVFFKEMKSQDGKHQGNCGDVNLVRLGNDINIDKKVVEFSLRHQIKTRMGEADFHTDPEQSKVRRQNIQRIILQEANIICGTLSSSGSCDLQKAFTSQHHDDTPFNCVIIEEAGQAKETETLIPLLFRCPSLVLVGDSEQLPPTVISQKTKELRFDQSLMARLCKCLHRLNPPRIHFLSEQYRMHPVIQNFPSKYFYRNLLKTDRKIAYNRCSSDWVCESYRVFDVPYGQDMREKRSYFNRKEVELTVELARLVSKRYRLQNPSKSLVGVVGVITPYSEQRVWIRKALQEKRLKNVVVHSIDEFQGGEMDCVIVSCVRSSSERDFIRFLESPLQMNISITRAKYSLFIVGHLNTLKEYEHWRALIDDAESRGTIITTNEQRYEHDARKILKEVNIRSFSRPISPNQTAHPSSPDASRARSTFNYPQPPEDSHHDASSRKVPFRSTFSRASRGHYSKYKRWQGYPFNVAPFRHQTFRASRQRHWSYKHYDRHRPWHYSNS